MDQQMQVDFDKLSDSDKRELQQSLNNEMQKAKIQECAPVSSHFHALSPLSTFSVVLYISTRTLPSTHPLRLPKR